MLAHWQTGLKRGLPLVVSLVVLALLFRSVDLRAVLAAVDGRVVAVMVPAMLLYGASTLWIEALSIRRMLPRVPESFGLWTAARLKCASYLPGLIHYTLGIGGLAILLRRRTGLRLGEAVSLVILISTTDLVVVLTSASAAAALAGIDTGGPRLGLLALVVGGAIVGMALLRTPRSLGPLDRLRHLAMFEGLRTVPLRRLLELIALRVVFASCFIAGCASAFFAFEVSVPFTLMAAGILLVALVSALPIAVAGLGTSQATFLYVFGDLAPDERLLAISLVLSFGMLALRALMGLVFARELTREALHDAGSVDT